MGTEEGKTVDFIEQLNKFNTVAFVPKGNSMYPFIKNKAQTVYITKKQGRLMPYDIALYIRSNGGYVLHRVLEIKEKGYVFCGDSQFNLEEVKEEQVVGLLSAFQRGKRTVEFTQKHREKAKKWHAKKACRKIRLGFYFFGVKVKAKLKKIFSKEGNLNDD